MHNIQRETAFSSSRYQVLIAGRRSGKSVGNVLMAALELSKTGKAVIYIGLKTTSIEQQFFFPVINMVEKMDYPIEKHDKGKHTLTMANGSSLVCVANSSLPEINAHRGGRYSLIIVDE
jgi:cysteine synthase